MVIDSVVTRPSAGAGVVMAAPISLQREKIDGSSETASSSSSSSSETDEPDTDDESETDTDEPDTNESRLPIRPVPMRQALNSAFSSAMKRSRDNIAFNVKRNRVATRP